ncbi:MAG: autoinducer binding domain-containing protein [Burkholderiaceae bacterium]|jgi:LuxR family transcriptional regulator|nr:autoinducer binding domain-containing protein [Burkholderiaceae bacterium]
MKNWQEDLLDIMQHNTTCENDIFKRIQDVANTLEFQYVAYGFQALLPLSKPKVILLNNYPQFWKDRYAQAGYIQIDPTIIHGRRSQEPILWTDQVFAEAPNLWNEARAHGLKVGWAQSSLDGLGAGGMLTLARSCQCLTRRELDAKQLKMRWLVQVTHFTISRLLRRNSITGAPALSDRELEILKWSADGKSAQDIADILKLSKSTVDFHIKNCIVKMKVPNKTAAVVSAALLGLLN